jgi:lysophospholipase L1-like esterase
VGNTSPVGSSRSRLLVVMAVVIALCGTATARADGGVYVALGDSYTSGPLIPNQHGQPIDCGRSDHNYPSLVAAALKVGTFVDVSCGSAETRHMTEPQTGLPLGGTNPPQFNGLRPDATLVTVGIGGNDAGLVGVAEKCAELGLTNPNPNGHACRNYWAPGGNDKVAARIEATKPKIAAVLQGIHQRSPKARVAIVGYPDPVPTDGTGCWPTVPLSPDDIKYIDELLLRINAMIKGQAEANGAEYIDTYADSVGHDVCKLPPNRWFEGLIPTEPAYPLHPNAKGEASMARSAIAVLSKSAGTGSAGGGGGGGTGARQGCLARHPQVAATRIGRVGLGYTRRGLSKRIAVAPARKTSRMWVYCTKRRSGGVAAVFSKRSRAGRVELVLSTAPSDAFRRAYPRRQRIARGFFRAWPGSRRLVGIQGGRVRFVALVSSGALRHPARLVRDLRLMLG